MNARSLLIGVCIAVTGTAGGAFAAERGTAEEATAMVDRAAAHYAAVGREQALRDFTEAAAEWRDRDLYVLCVSADNVMIAHGANQKLVGMKMDAMKDADGEFISPKFFAAADTGDGWATYHWADPVTKKIDLKSTLVRKFGDDYCGVGIYK